DQVKVRGYRIELGEVETQLTDLEGVDSALVITTELTGSEQLVGYVRPNRELDEAAKTAFLTELQLGLSGKLPDYMVPNVLMVIEQWPLTNNGKVDNKALPQPDGSLLQGEYIAPETETEQALAEIWSELLGVELEKVSTTANFFALGGHSLLVIRMIAMVKKRLQVSLDISKLYDNANVKEIAELCEQVLIKSELAERLSKHHESDLEEVEF
ncbi:phosphopantetheine-binding protein, partial [Pseudoalteromonas luteoviolacea]